MKLLKSLRDLSEETCIIIHRMIRRSLMSLLMGFIGQIDLFLEHLSYLTKEEEQIQHFRSILDK